MKNSRLPLFLAITWFILSTILLTIPGTRFPKDDWLSKIWFDKWVHIGLFGILVFLWCWVWYKKQSREKRLIKTFCLLALVGIAYGIGMEFVQKYFVVNRSFDGGDIIADALGCVAGLAMGWRRYIKK